MNQTYTGDEIVIVGIGCVYPQAKNIKEFYKNIKNSKCSIRKFPESRLDTKIYYNSEKKVEDKTYTFNAGFVDDEVLNFICKKNNLNKNEYSRLQLFGIEATNQAIKDINDFNKNKTKIILGCMTPDSCLPNLKFILGNKKKLKKFIKENFNQKEIKIIYEEIDKYCNQFNLKKEILESNIYPNSITKIIKSKFNLNDENFLVDSACSSSHTAIQIAVRKLKLNKCETVITGGIASNLGPESFVSWSQIGGLAQNKCLPFDIKSKGMSQGEGSGIIILQKLKDALKYKNKIYGIIKNIDATSDGKATSIFAPTKNGQINTYSKVYNSLKNSKFYKNLNYIECHGTGTIVGDKIEIESLTEFFNNKIIPIGSIKALIGHTKGAAGAAGIIKSLMIIKNSYIPKNAYFNELNTFNTNLFVNKKKLKINSHPIKIGVSSFGFGGINSHLLLEEYIQNNKIKNQNKSSIINNDDDPLILVDSTKISKKNFLKKYNNYNFKIPNQSLKNIDEIQLRALIAIKEILNKPNINITNIENEKINVISATTLGLDKINELGKRIYSFELNHILKGLNQNLINRVVESKNMYPKITEDTGAGILNNVISGRITNQFNFKGINLNIDSDSSSMPCALNIISELIIKDEGLYFLIFTDEIYDKENLEILRGDLHCLLLTSKNFALKNNLPIQKQMEVLIEK